MMRKRVQAAVAVALALMLGACSGIGGSARGGEGLVANDGIAPAPVPPRAQARYQAGREAMQAGELEQALEEMVSLAEDYPWLSGPLLDAALICQQLEQPEDAEHWYRRALQSNAYNLDAYNAYAVFLRGQGRFHDARARYLEALSVSEAHPATHYNLGILRCSTPPAHHMENLYLLPPHSSGMTCEVFMPVAAPLLWHATWSIYACHCPILVAWHMEYSCPLTPHSRGTPHGIFMATAALLLRHATWTIYARRCPAHAACHVKYLCPLLPCSRCTPRGVFMPAAALLQQYAKLSIHAHHCPAPAAHHMEY